MVNNRHLYIEKNKLLSSVQCGFDPFSCIDFRQVVSTYTSQLLKSSYSLI